MLKNIADQLEKQVELNRKIRGAMTYPIVVVCVIGIIFIVMMMVIVPIFKKLFATLGGQLPLPDPDPDHDLEHPDQLAGAAS